LKNAIPQTPDGHVEKISRCHKAIVKNRITRWNFPLTIILWAVYRWRLSRLFDKLDRLLPADIEHQAPNLSSGSLYTLSEACVFLWTRKKDKPIYLKWSNQRNVQENINRERRRLSTEAREVFP